MKTNAESSLSRVDDVVSGFEGLQRQYSLSVKSSLWDRGPKFSHLHEAEHRKSFHKVTLPWWSPALWVHFLRASL
jgi:hypothetical protein